MTDFIDAEGFRANVGIVLIRDDRQVLLGGRTGGRGWQFPQGGVRRNESPEQALYRELQEELGLERAEAVRRYLNMQHHIPLHRINVISYGETTPVTDNKTREHRAQNRRVVLVVLK